MCIFPLLMFDDFADFFVEFFVGVVKFAIDSVVKFAINLVIFLVRHVLVSDVRHTLHRVRKLFIFPDPGKRRHRRAESRRFVQPNKSAVIWHTSSEFAPPPDTIMRLIS